MSSEARLYKFSQESRDQLRKFRLTTSRASGPQAVICLLQNRIRTSRIGSQNAQELTWHEEPNLRIYLDFIDKKTFEIRQDDDKVVYKSLDEIADDLPDNSPRYVLLSYPLTLPSGRLSVPYVMLYYLPKTCNNEARMMYAGAKELMRNTSEVGKVIDIDSAEDLEEIPAKLGADQQ